jgi:hypothetical protein
MRTKLYALAIAAGMTLTAYSLTVGSALAQEAPKNLKVFPANTPKPELKKAMKGIAAALGVQCDFCHNLDDMAQDTEHKEKARAMMRMVMEINKKHFAGKPKVGCITCHNGKEEPKAP